MKKPSVNPRNQDKGRREAAGRPGPALADNRRPTINDIARLAEVSKKTVSRVINESPFVREAPRQRVTAIMCEPALRACQQGRGSAFRRSRFLPVSSYD